MDAISDTIEAARATAASDAAEKLGGEPKLTEAVRWRAPVPADPARTHQPRNPSLPTFVGLIILILTFFIVLTSISLHDKSKSNAAIASVQQAFNNAAAAEDGPAKKDEEIAQDYIAGLARRIQSLIPLMGGRKAPASDHQVLWLPTELAFAPEGAALAPVFPSILREIVDALEGVPERLVPLVEMRLCAGGPSDRLRARAVAVGEALAAAGAPIRQFSVGVSSCDVRLIGIAIAVAPAP